MKRKNKHAKQFVTNVLDQEFAKAQEQLQIMVNEKLQRRIREAAKAVEQD